MAVHCYLMNMRLVVTCYVTDMIFVTTHYLEDMRLMAVHYYFMGMRLMAALCYCCGALSHGLEKHGHLVDMRLMAARSFLVDKRPCGIT